jgi:hypothetical protein
LLSPRPIVRLLPPYVAALTAGDRRRAAALGAAWVEHVVAAVRHYLRGETTRERARIFVPGRGRVRRRR